MKIEWSRNERPYSNGWVGMAGTIHMFTISWDGINGGRGQDGPWILYCRLPGVKDDVGYFPNPELAQERANDVLSRWLVRAGIKEEE
jgi:hypothetical protein